MQVSRKKTRRFLLQKLYAKIYGPVNSEEFYDSFFEGILEFDVDQAYFDEMFEIITTKDKEILSIVKKYAPKFDLDTMLKTNILSMAIAIAEMLWLKEEIPAKVSLNEAIELAKYFGDDTSKKIVNGILNSFYSDIEKYQNSSVELSVSEGYFS